jgi:THO complex subunit 4
VASGQPKAQPKSAANAKGTPAVRGGKAARGRGGKAKSARPAKKTAEELDSEMMDYFGSTGNNETEAGAAGNAQPATNGDANMDEVLVSWSYLQGVDYC